jgi:hypothetical protein
MALQVEDALSGNVAKFSRFDRMERVFTGTKAGKPIATSGVARVNYSELIPPATIDVDRAVHVEPQSHLRKRSSVLHITAPFAAK